jgi:hypothetical protein
LEGVRSSLVLMSQEPARPERLSGRGGPVNFDGHVLSDILFGFKLDMHAHNSPKRLRVSVRGYSGRDPTLDIVS